MCGREETNEPGSGARLRDQGCVAINRRCCFPSELFSLGLYTILWIAHKAQVGKTSASIIKSPITILYTSYLKT